METFLAQLVNGLAMGSIYAVCVTGLNLLVLVGGTFNYAYPHMVIISMYAAWYVNKFTGGNLFLALPAAVVSAVILNLLVEPIFRPMVKRGAGDQTFVVAIGVAMILNHVMSKQFRDGLPISFDALGSSKAALQFGIVAISLGQLLTFIGSIIAVAAFMYLLYRTMTGRAFRSMAQSPFVTRLLGIPVNRTALASYAVAGLLAGVTSIFLAMGLGSAYPALGDSLALKCLATVLFAGVGNLVGGLVCGLILGVAEGMTTGYVAGMWCNAVAFGMIMVAVMFKPKGLFGAKT